MDNIVGYTPNAGFTTIDSRTSGWSTSVDAIKHVVSFAGPGNGDSGTLERVELP